MTKSTRIPLESEPIALAQELSPNGFRARQHTRDRPNSGTETRAQNGPIFRAQKQGQQNVTQLLGDTFVYPECGPENGICFRPRETSAVTGGSAKRITPQPAHKETAVLSKNPCRDHLHPTLGMQQKHELIDSTPCTRMTACSRLGNTDKLQHKHYMKPRTGATRTAHRHMKHCIRARTNPGQWTPAKQGNETRSH